MKAVTKFESDNGDIYDSEDDAKFDDLVCEFGRNLIDDFGEYGREQVAREVRHRVGDSIYERKLTYFLKWVRKERYAFTAFLEATKDAD